MPQDLTSASPAGRLPADLSVELVYQDDLTAVHRQDVRDLQDLCFPDDPEDEIQENMEYFVARSIAKVLAYSAGELLGCVSVFRREIQHEGREIILGGFGGTCTREDVRGRGIGTTVCQVAMDCLRREGCAVATLAVDPESGTDRFYERFGFALLGKPFIFVTARGERKIPERDVAMLAPVLSRELFEHIMRSRSPLDIGPEKGYW